MNDLNVIDPIQKTNFINNQLNGYLLLFNTKTKHYKLLKNSNTIAEFDADGEIHANTKDYLAEIDRSTVLFVSDCIKDCL